MFIRRHHHFHHIGSRARAHHVMGILWSLAQMLCMELSKCVIAKSVESDMRMLRWRWHARIHTGINVQLGCDDDHNHTAYGIPHTTYQKQFDARSQQDLFPTESLISSHSVDSSAIKVQVFDEPVDYRRRHWKMWFQTIREHLGICALNVS